MNYKEMFSLLARYAFLIVLGLFGFSLIYNIFSPLTLYPVYLLLSLIYKGAILIPEANTILIQGQQIALVNACIAGSAYYLLLLLNFTTPLSIKTRIKSLFFLLLSFLIVNIIRITIFSSLFISGYEYFNITHITTWYVGSTIFIVALWFANVFIFKIQNIPIYSEIQNILKDIFPKKHIAKHN